MNSVCDFSEVERQQSISVATINELTQQLSSTSVTSMTSLSDVENSELVATRARISKLTVQAEEWAECTAEWHQKWEKMRAKREKAVKEATMYREKVDSMTRQLFMWKEKYLQLEKENDKLKKLLSPDGILLLSKSPSPGEVVLGHKGSVSSTVHNGHSDSVFDNGCSVSRKSDEGFDSASENLSPAQSVDLHAAFSLQPQLKLIEALVHRNEQTHKSVSTSRSPSPSRTLTDSQKDEVLALKQKCEQLERDLQEERKLRLSSHVSSVEARVNPPASHAVTSHKPHSQIPVNSTTTRPVTNSLPHHPIHSKRTSLKVGSKVTHEYITRHGKECFEEVLL